MVVHGPPHPIRRRFLNDAFERLYDQERRLARVFTAFFSLAIAFGLSVPVAWWTASQWLGDFAYRVDVGAGVFLLSGAGSLALALLTVSHQSIRAALGNPVETLRHE